MEGRIGRSSEGCHTNVQPFQHSEMLKRFRTGVGKTPAEETPIIAAYVQLPWIIISKVLLLY